MKNHRRIPTRRPREEGFAILAAIVFMVIIAGMGASVAALAEKQAGTAGEVIGGNQAFLAADAGLEIARAQMTGAANCTAANISGSNTSGNVTAYNVSFATAGNVSLSFTKNGTGYIIQGNGVSSTLGGGNLRKQRAVWNASACTAGSNNTTGGDDVVKFLTGYPSTDYACNGTRTVSMPSLNPSSFPSSKSNGSSKTVSHDSTETMAPGNYKEIKVGKNGTLEFEDDDDGDDDGRTYVKKDLTAKKNSVIILAPGDYYFADDIKLGKNVTVKIDPPGAVNFFVKKNFTIGSGSDINADGAGTFMVQMYDDDAKFSVGSQSNFKGVVVAPGEDAKVTFNEGANVEGAILTGGKATLGSNVTFNGTVLAENDVKVKQGVVVKGALAAKDDIKLKKNASVTGCMDAGDDIGLEGGGHGNDHGNNDRDNDRHDNDRHDNDRHDNDRGDHGDNGHGNNDHGDNGHHGNNRFGNGGNYTYTYKNPPDLPAWMSNWGGSGNGTSGGSAVSRSNEQWQDPV